MDFSPYGSWTLESKEFSRGAEPDECYVIGEPSGEPARPDLAIEVIWTSGGISKLEIYRKLGVPELWFWQGGKLSLYALRGEDYQPIDRSEVLVGIDHRQLEAFVELTPVSRAVRSYLAALREVPVRG